MLLMLFLLFQNVTVIVDPFSLFYPSSWVAHAFLLFQIIAVIDDPSPPLLSSFTHC